MSQLSSQIELHDFQCPVHLGWGEDERRSPQTVSFDLVVRFPSLPKACFSDELNETLCYDVTSQAIHAVCAKKPYKLIEHLGHEVFQALKEAFPAGVKIRLKTTKVHPPIPALKGGASFVLEG